jgi:hypothetical protein
MQHAPVVPLRVVAEVFQDQEQQQWWVRYECGHLEPVIHLPARTGTALRRRCWQCGPGQCQASTFHES